MADYFDKRPPKPVTLDGEAALKVWAKAKPQRTVQPSMHRLPSTGKIEHISTCREGGEIVATGRSVTPVGASRDACAQLGL